MMSDKINNLFQYLNYKKLGYILICLSLLCIVSTALYLGFIQSYVSSYFAINGDFQNYNVLRRFLDCQIPFVDFASYLGMGVIFLNVPLLSINNTFTASLFVTSFTNYICFAIFIITVLWATTKNKIIAYVGGSLGFIFPLFPRIIALISMITGPLPFVNLWDIGNSMRMERAFLPIVLIGMLIISLKISNRNIFDELKSWKINAFIGFIIGFFIIWSNDYGFACVASSFIMISLLQYYTQHKLNSTFVKNIGSYLIFIPIGLFTSASIITLGRPFSYIQSVLGTGGFQYWYYGRWDKYQTIGDILGNQQFVMYSLLLIILGTYYVYRIYKQKFELSDIIVLFILLSTFFGSLLYFYASGGAAFEAFSFAISVTVIGLIIRFVLMNVTNVLKSLKNTDKRKQTLKMVGVILLILLVGFNLVYVTYNYTVPAATKNFDKTYAPQYPYVTELGGYIPNGDSLYQLREIVGEEIIKGDYRYVATIDYDYTNWEQWILRANWFFYKHLYESYIPVHKIGYNILWEKTNTKTTVDCELVVSLQRINDYEYLLSFTSDCKENIVADVDVTYKIGNKWNMYRLQTYKPLVRVFDSHGGNYNIPDTGGSYSIPVFLDNGEGNVRIVCSPHECMVLEITDVEINEIFRNYFTY